jgi:hypothetical protein
MASEAIHRHDISDELYQKLQPCLPGEEGKVGRPAVDNSRFLNAILGFFEQELHGEIYLLSTEIGREHS